MMASMKTTGDYPEAISDEYGYGLSIHLNWEQCKALGITEPLRAGTQVTINALAFVSTSSESADSEKEEGDTKLSLSLQITNMELSGELDSAPWLQKTGNKK